MQRYSELQETELKVVQGGRTDSENELRYVSELYESNKAELLNKDERIRILEEEISQMSSLAESMKAFEAISAEAQASYEDLAGLSFAYTLETDFSKTDTIPVFVVRWKDGVRRRDRRDALPRLTKWLQVRLKNDRIRVYESGG